MGLSQIFGGLAIMMVLYIWQFPLKLLYVNSKMTKSDYKSKYWFGVGLIVLFFAAYITGTMIELEQKWILTIVTITFLLIILYDFQLNLNAKDIMDIKNKFSDKMLIAVRVIAIVIFTMILIETVESFFDSSVELSLLGIFEFSEGKIIAATMLYRIFGFAYVSVITYMYFIYDYAKDRYKKSDENKAEEAKKIIEKYIHWKNILLIVLLGVMLSFFHLAELDFRTPTDDSFHIAFVATRDVYHLIATAIFIPLFFDILRTKDKDKFNNTKHRINVGKRRYIGRR